MVAERKANLEQWCRTSYGEAFSALVHVNAVRLFVESVLRYGLPPCFVAAGYATERLVRDEGYGTLLRRRRLRRSRRRLDVSAHESEESTFREGHALILILE